MPIPNGWTHQTKFQLLHFLANFAGLVVMARSLNPIPFRTRPLNSSAPMVLCLKTRESRSPPGLQSPQESLFTATQKAPADRNVHGGFLTFRPWEGRGEGRLDGDCSASDEPRHHPDHNAHMIAQRSAILAGGVEAADLHGFQIATDRAVIDRPIVRSGGRNRESGREDCSELVGKLLRLPAARHCLVEVADKDRLRVVTAIDDRSKPLTIAMMGLPASQAAR